MFQACFSAALLVDFNIFLALGDTYVSQSIGSSLFLYFYWLTGLRSQWTYLIKNDKLQLLAICHTFQMEHMYTACTTTPNPGPISISTINLLYHSHWSVYHCSCVCSAYELRSMVLFFCLCLYERNCRSFCTGVTKNNYFFAIPLTIFTFVSHWVSIMDWQFIKHFFVSISVHFLPF